MTSLSRHPLPPERQGFRPPGRSAMTGRAFHFRPADALPGKAESEGAGRKFRPSALRYVRPAFYFRRQLRKTSFPDSTPRSVRRKNHSFSH